MRGLLLIFLALPIVYWGATLGLCSEADVLCEQAFFSASLGTGLRRVFYPLLLIGAVILLVRGVDEYRRADLRVIMLMARGAAISVIAAAGYTLAIGNWLAGVPLLIFGFSVLDPGLPDQQFRLAGVALILLLLSVGFGSWGIAAAGSTMGLALASHRVRLKPFNSTEDETAPGQRSEVRTAYLDMWLDRTSGAMGGRVHGGRYAGTALEALALDDLLLLHEECSTDPQSANLIEAWLDRRHPDWRDRLRRHQPPELPTAGRMTDQIALQILGIELQADEQAINQAHRTLIRRVHPDQGGNHYFAALANEARDHLLRRRRRMT